MIQYRIHDYDVWPQVEPSFFSDLDIVWFKNQFRMLSDKPQTEISMKLFGLKVTNLQSPL